jgi:hypothetical protein
MGDWSVLLYFNTFGFKGVHVLAIVPKSPSLYFPSRVTKIFAGLTGNTIVEQNFE